ncbi:MocR-like pyridoxine biosynthesis transcription factor PdxR [Nakamurella lactea]|uniref:MocR-like pyridoxine biosynthesis transcription factor PdxR n=1 Tax=Nakamurella lactea TaxID=459515 RepID=UPI0003FBF492|nr:PLP-dependent aminotransferase family protein [Nakamurella lactea]
MDIDLPIGLVRDGPPLPVQIADAVRDLIARGVLQPGERLPGSRPLADRLGVSRGTVVAGWDQLIAEGYLTTAHGSGTVVNPDLAGVHPGSGSAPASSAGGAVRRPTTGPPELRDVVDLRPGRPDVAAVADSTWRHAWRVAAADPGSGAADPAGLPALRSELAAHLRQMRGLLVSPDELLVTNGARDGLATVLQVLAARRGRLIVAVENPGYPSLRQVPRRLGATVIEVDVDDEGLVVPQLDAVGGRVPDLVMVTPSHQYPMGASMTVTRRLELLDWARRHHAVVVEDDYDSELRYVGAPLPALAALDRRQEPDGERVVTLGSFSKTVTPALGAGFLLLPAGLRAQALALRSDVGPTLSSVVQRALAEYLANGGLRRHTQRMRRAYRRRRNIVTDGLDGIAGVTVRGMDGGLHAVVEWPADTADRHREQLMQQHLSRAGIEVGALSDYWSHSTEGTERQIVRYGLVIGYTAIEEARLVAAVTTIRNQLARHRRG